MKLSRKCPRVISTSSEGQGADPTLVDSTELPGSAQGTSAALTSGSTETSVKPAGRAETTATGEDPVTTGTETTFPNRRVRKPKLWKYETEKAYLIVVLFTKA